MRAFLGGKAVPRDEFALIGMGQSSGTPVVLLLEDGDVFTPEDYMSLGYTNFEAWCVGGAGGRGGDATDVITWRVSILEEIMPDDIWAYVIAKANYDASRSNVSSYGGVSNPGTPEPPVGVIYWTVGSGGYINWQLTPEGLEWLYNPTHKAKIINWLEPIAQPGGKYIGGGGGGGGLHVVKGLLSDLPASVVAAVGQEGAAGAAGQAFQATPMDLFPTWNSNVDVGDVARWNYLNRFPNGRPLMDGPAEGSPGGASSFGDICKASGGMGGKPAIQWVGSSLRQYAHGGQGGIGGSDVPGGGADGATTSTAMGKDGSWNGTIGAGGGGGRGGIKSAIVRTFPTTAVSDIPATAGGRGSLNFGDTSVYGARGPLGTYFASILNYARMTLWGNDWGPPWGWPFANGMSAYIGELLSIDDALIKSTINPGSGGGARIPGNRKYGSRSQGYIHDGAVLLRLSKID
jgi:hypothetical protein